MNDASNLSKQVYVPLWAVVYACRYGLNRASYASSDVVSLAEMFWDEIPDFIKQQFKDDLLMHRNVASMGPPEEVYARWDVLFARRSKG